MAKTRGISRDRENGWMGIASFQIGHDEGDRFVEISRFNLF